MRNRVSKCFKSSQKLSKENRLETGFSMLESVVVVGVVLALSVGGFVAYGPVVDNAKRAEVKSAAAEVYTAAMANHFDGDYTTTPQDAIDNWNESTDKIRVELLAPSNSDPEAGAMTTGVSLTAYEPVAGEDFCVAATLVASPHITNGVGACPAHINVGGAEGAPPTSGDNTIPGGTTSPDGALPGDGTGAPSDGSSPEPVTYVDATPTLTKMTYKCDVTKTGTLPMRNSITGTATWSDGLTQSYTEAATPQARTLEAEIEYKVTFEGTYASFHDSDLQSCLRSLDHWGSATGVTNATGAFAFANNLVFVPEHIPTTITNMTLMFKDSANFNHGNVSNWNVSNVTDINHMFQGASSFNQPLHNWDVSKVQNMWGIFHGASSFNQPLSDWDVSNVTIMHYMFSNATAFNQPLDMWNVSNNTGMSNMFANAIAFNQPLNSWNTSNVTTMWKMFDGATSFNQAINNWDVSKVTHISGMFRNATAFDQPLGTWNISSVETMEETFENATSFNQPIGNWNTTNVSNMNHVFRGATAFNQPLNNWNVSNVYTMWGVFYGASSFNQPLSNWDMSNVSTMHYMFANATAFNRPLDMWNVSKSTGMSNMFAGASSFNQPLNSWNTSNVETMWRMFWGASSFNQPLNNWDISKVTHITWMFRDVDGFNQDLSGWNTQSVVESHGFASSSFPEAYLPPGVIPD